MGSATPVVATYGATPSWVSSAPCAPQRRRTRQSSLSRGHTPSAPPPLSERSHPLVRQLSRCRTPALLMISNDHRGGRTSSIRMGEYRNVQTKNPRKRIFVLVRLADTFDKVGDRIVKVDFFFCDFIHRFRERLLHCFWIFSLIPRPRSEHLRGKNAHLFIS